MPFVRTTQFADALVVVASKFQHEQGRCQGRECELCGSRWTVDREGDEVHVWRNGVPEDIAILDFFGNNVAVECCRRQ